MPPVSVIIPAYNCAVFLPRTLESLARQDYTDFEVVIVDDGSTDRTRQVAEGFTGLPRLTVLSQSNKGPSAARNAGAAAASHGSRYMLFLDADDLLYADALNRLVAYMDANPLVGLAHFDCVCIDEHDRILNDCEVDFTPMRNGRYVPQYLWARKLKPDEVETPFVSIYCLAGIIPSLAFVRRSVFQECGMWDEALPQHYEDTDLWLRMALHAPVHHLSAILALYRRHAAQSTKRTGNAELDHRYQGLLSKWTNIAGLTLEQRALIRQAETFRCGGLAVHKNVHLSVDHARKGDVWNSMRYAYGALRYLMCHI